MVTSDTGNSKPQPKHSAGGRKVGRVARIVCALCFVATLVLGAASHMSGALAGRIGSSNSMYVRNEYGKLSIYLHKTDAGEQPQWLLSTWPHDFSWRSPHHTHWWRNAGFDYGVGGTAGGNTVHQWVIPHWALAVMFAVPLAITVFFPRPRKGLTCQMCGYDLRGSQGRPCPECGRIACS